MHDSLRPHGQQHARLPCNSFPRVCSNVCPLSWWCHPTISSLVVPFSSCLQSFPASVFSNKSALCITWPNYWSFSFNISPSNEYSGFIFIGNTRSIPWKEHNKKKKNGQVELYQHDWVAFRMDWLDLLVVQGTLKSLLQHHISKP